MIHVNHILETPNKVSRSFGLSLLVVSGQLRPGQLATNIGNEISSLGHKVIKGNFFVSEMLMFVIRTV